MKTKIIVPILIVAGLAVLGGAYYVYHVYQQSQQATADNLAALNSISHKPGPAPIPLPTKEAYFGIKASIGTGDNTTYQYYLINLATKKSQPFIDDSYDIVWDQTYPQNHLILHKGNSLFSYEVTTGKTVDMLSAKKLNLGANEDIYIKPSISEPDKFYIEIYTSDPLEVNEMAGAPREVSTRSYWFNAATSTLTDAGKDLKLEDGSNCNLYDSKNSRFFSWPCGEGIGSAPPLKILDLAGRENGTVATAETLGFTTDGTFTTQIERDDNQLVVIGNTGPTTRKFVWLNLSAKVPTQTAYTVEDKYMGDIAKYGVYSVALDTANHTIVLGGSNSIVLMRYDDNNKVMGSKSFVANQVYANNIYLYNNAVYYQTTIGGQLKAIDLKAWEALPLISSQNGSPLGIFMK